MVAVAEEQGKVAEATLGAEVGIRAQFGCQSQVWMVLELGEPTTRHVGRTRVGMDEWIKSKWRGIGNQGGACTIDLV